MTTASPIAPQRVVFVGNSVDHAEQIAAALQREGLLARLERVETRGAFEGALANDPWDIVLSDFRLPRFSALDALASLAKSDQRIPLIVVSGFVGEEATAELIRAGAADFITKSNLQRLPGAIRRSLREARAMREREIAVEALAASEARFKTLVANLPGVVFQCEFGPEGPVRWLFLSERCAEIIGVDPEALLGDPARFAEAVLPEDRAGLAAACRAACERGETLAWEGRLGAGHGVLKWISLRATTVHAGRDRVLADGLINDITESKLAEAEILRSHEQLREFSRHLDRAKEEERASIAREVHDELGMLLTAAKIEIATLARQLPPGRSDIESRSGAAEALIDQAMEAGRRISRRLRPAILDCGIVAAVEWQARDFSKHLGIPCEFAAVHDIDLHPERATAVFRIFQEALTNIARHARARRVRVALSEDLDGFLTLCVTDDGRGIIAAEANKPGSFGLRGMQERAHGLGGRLDVRSPAPGQGTAVTLRVPLPHPEADPGAESGQLPLEADP